MPDPSPIVIVGSGAGGGMLAYALTVRHGVDVTLIEAGREYTPQTDSPLVKHEWETEPISLAADATANFPVLAGDREALAEQYSNCRSLVTRRAVGAAAGESGWGLKRLVDGDLRMPPLIQRVIGVGGTTLRYQGVAERFHPSVFREQTLDGVGLDWPFDYNELEPWYSAAEQVLHVAGPDSFGRFKGPRSKPFPHPAHTFSHASQVAAQGARDLGWTVHHAPVAALSVKADDRPECNYCGQCARGCPRGDRGSVDYALMPKAKASGKLTLLKHHIAHELTFHDDGRAKGVVCTNRDIGEKVEVEASKMIVLATGAVATPRLLLCSTKKGGATPGAQSERLGHHALETLTVNMTVRLPEPVHAYRGLPIDNHIYDFASGVRDAPYVRGFVLAHAAGPLDVAGPFASATRLAPGFAADALLRARDIFGHATGLIATGEQLSQYQNRVELDTTAKDQWGYAQPKLTSRLTGNDLALLDAMRGQLHQWRQALAAELLEMFTSYDTPAGGAELRGTCRMSTTEGDGVTNGDGRLHDTPNLYVADASLFPSASTGNPTLTIQALALRLAHHLKTQLG